MKTTERRYDIDWLRVIAIGLLLIYHIAIVFQPWALFIGFIKSETSLEGIWYPMTMLNVWRIPLLFFVSGMGVFFAMKKRNWQQLLLDRAKRILLPFVFGYVAITPLHMYVFQSHYNMPLTYFSSSGHLWFLGNIIVYVLLLFPLFYYLQKNDNNLFKRLLSKLMTTGVGPFCISLFFVLEVYFVQPQIFEMYAQNWHGFFNGFLAFFFGYLFVYIGNSFWQTVSKWTWGYVFLALLLFAIRFIGVAPQSAMYTTAIESICWILGVFGLGYRYLNKPSAALHYLSTAVYPIYIIHMFVLYVGSWLLLPLDMHPMLQFVAITLFTFLCCFLIYEFILKRVALLRPLFGLSWTFKKTKNYIKV